MNFQLPALVRTMVMAAMPLAGFVVLLAAAPIDDQAARTQLMGKWQGDAKSSWTLEEKGDSIHVVNSDDAQVVEDFACNTSGKECTVKHAGHASKVSIWFNGPRLVELETTGSQTVKRRFSVTGNDTMDLETIPVSQGGSPEITHFKRVPTQTAKQ